MFTLKNIYIYNLNKISPIYYKTLTYIKTQPFILHAYTQIEINN